MTVLHQLVLTAGPPEHRVLMPRVDLDAFSGGELNRCQPDGDKKVRIVGFTQLVVDIGQSLTRGLPAQKVGLDEDLGGHHEQRRRHPFSGNICHDQAEVIGVSHKVVIEISAHLSCRTHAGIEADFLLAGEAVKVHGKLAGLDPACRVELRADPLFFGRDQFNLVDVQHGPGGLLGKGFCQNLNLSLAKDSARTSISSPVL